jgi:hypothetical protein
MQFKFNRKHEMNFKSTIVINLRSVFIFIAYDVPVCHRTLRPLFHPDYNTFIMKFSQKFSLFYFHYT